MEPLPRLRWGVLSTAAIARRKVIPGIKGAEHCEVVAIASRDLALAERVAAEHSIHWAHGSYGRSSPPERRAVYTLARSPPPTWTVAAAEPEHVLCEKPLARRPPDAERMIEPPGRPCPLMAAFMYPPSSGSPCASSSKAVASVR